MSDVDEHGRPEPPVAADEGATLLGFLERQRATLAWKCGGLDSTGLQATTAASTMTLGGLLKHLAVVEVDMCERWLHGRSPGQPWESVDWDATPDWPWQSSADDSPEELFALWQRSVDRSRAVFAEALADGGVDQLATGITNDRGEAPTLRYILITLIEEYARHNGHADLIRESIDGLTGE
jgi:hypothetical protein